MWETTIQVEQSEVVRGEPGQLWALMRSPALWSLWRTPAFMFDVPGAQPLRFYIGITRRGLASSLFEIVDELPGTVIKVRSLPSARQEFTFSVGPGRRGTARASMQVKEIVPRQFKIDYE